MLGVVSRRGLDSVLGEVFSGHWKRNGGVGAAERARVKHSADTGAGWAGKLFGFCGGALNAWEGVSATAGVSAGTIFYMISPK
mmetsp:Transcript_16621/g.26355  ORF Transcript_16621/g.26355 Transcript_16621/m.26355 type:complete len:83 (-) Transcript_16621:89-337(-)